LLVNRILVEISHGEQRIELDVEIISEEQEIKLVEIGFTQIIFM
jgi:hypothetical protein